MLHSNNHYAAFAKQAYLEGVPDDATHDGHAAPTGTNPPL